MKASYHHRGNSFASPYLYIIHAHTLARKNLLVFKILKIWTQYYMICNQQRDDRLPLSAKFFFSSGLDHHRDRMIEICSWWSPQITLMLVFLDLNQQGWISGLLYSRLSLFCIFMFRGLEVPFPLYPSPSLSTPSPWITCFEPMGHLGIIVEWPFSYFSW